MCSTNLAKTSQNDLRDVGWASSCSAWQLPPFLVVAVVGNCTSNTALDPMMGSDGPFKRFLFIDHKETEEVQTTRPTKIVTE